MFERSYSDYLEANDNSYAESAMKSAIIEKAKELGVYKALEPLGIDIKDGDWGVKSIDKTIMYLTDLWEYIDSLDIQDFEYEPEYDDKHDR